MALKKITLGTSGTGGTGDMTKSIYDADGDGIIDPSALPPYVLSTTYFSGTATNADPVVPKDGALTNSKLASVATATIKGRVTAGTGSTEDLTAAQVKTLIGVSGTNTGDETGATIKTKLSALTGTNRLDASAIQNLPSGGGSTTLSVAGTYTASIPFDTLITTMSKTITGPITLTPNTVGAVGGYGTLLRVTADGNNEPDVSAFKVAAGSSYVNINGVVNLYCFWYDGFSDYWVNIVTATVAGGSAVQLSPPTIAASAISSTAIDVTVGTVSNASSYELEWSATGTSGWTSLATVSGVYHHTSLTASTPYYYRARAVGNGTTFATSNYATTNATTTSGVLTAVLTETFNRANVTNISGSTTSDGTKTWSDQSYMASVGILNNEAYVGSHSDPSDAVAVVDAGKRDVDARFTIGTVAADNTSAYIAFLNGANAIKVNLYTGAIQQNQGGATVLTVPGSGTSSPGDIIRAVLVGSSLTIYRNSTQIISSNSVNTVTTGSYVGLDFNNGSACTVDKIEVF
jgi:hypothetical protein